MFLEIHSTSDQVAQHLRAEIRDGRWRLVFPGTPALAKELGVDRKTITAAIAILEQEGLLQSQGPGKPRLILKPPRRKAPRQHIRFMVYDDDDRQRSHVMDLIPRVQVTGHHIELESLTLSGLGMNLNRIKSHVLKHPADAWILLAASREILEWFAAQKIPVMALSGRRRQVPVASAGPDKVAAMNACVERLVELGHRRIVLLAREERRQPTIGHVELAFLKALDSHGIEASPYHLPDWKDTPDDFHACLQRLFEHTPPTALILDEAQFYVAAMQYLAKIGLSAPKDISLVSCDTHPIFTWCRPTVCHIHWESEPVVEHIVKWILQLSRGKKVSTAHYTPAQFIESGSIGPVNYRLDP